MFVFAKMVDLGVTYMVSGRKLAVGKRGGTSRCKIPPAQSSLKSRPVEQKEIKQSTM
jgi:hypothetical protein